MKKNGGNLCLLLSACLIAQCDFIFLDLIKENIVNKMLFS